MMRELDYQSMLGFLKWAKANVEKHIIAGNVLREEHKTFLMYGFLAETGLRATDCKLIERRGEKEIGFYFARRNATDHEQIDQLQQRDAEIARLQGMVKYAESIIKELREEVDHLKGKR